MQIHFLVGRSASNKIVLCYLNAVARLIEILESRESVSVFDKRLKRIGQLKSINSIICVHLNAPIKERRLGRGTRSASMTDLEMMVGLATVGEIPVVLWQ